MKDVNYHDALMDEDEESYVGQVVQAHQRQGLELLEEKWKEELRWFTEPVRPLLCCGLRLHQELHAGQGGKTHLLYSFVHFCLICSEFEDLFFGDILQYGSIVG